MYQRSVVILERYFAEKFYYKDKNNLKNNYENYRRLIDILEKYQEITEEEDKIINECEDIASKIKRIQKSQGSLYRRNLKLEEDRNSLFESIDEAANDLSRQLNNIEKEIDENNEQMKPIGKEFIEALSTFNETSENRTDCGRKRRRIEKEYRSLLEKTTSSINDMDTEKIATIKRFIAEDNAISSEELKALMTKNGEKEKVPFDTDVIENAISFGQDINKQEAKLLVDVYEKTKSLVNEADSGSIKIKRYKKLAKDVTNKLNFINVQKEYLTQFLDNERLSVNLGKREHKKLMKEACDDFNNDIQQIKNLNEILLKETINKATQKMYTSMYNAEYLNDLQKQETEFENKLGELNLVGQILNPIYWRINSIEKVYDVFDNIVTSEYDRDLSKFKIEEPEEDDSEGIMDYYDNIEDEEPEKIEEEKKNIKDIISDEEDDDYDEFEDEESDIDDDYEEIQNIEDDDFDEDDDYEYDEQDDEIDDDFDDEEDDDDYSDDDNDEMEDEYEEEETDEPEKETDDSELIEEDDDENKSEDSDEEDDFEEDDNDEYEEDNYDDEIDIILQNRKKILGKSPKKKQKNTKTKSTKRKGLFGLGSKKGR